MAIYYKDTPGRAGELRVLLHDLDLDEWGATKSWVISSKDSGLSAPPSRRT